MKHRTQNILTAFFVVVMLSPIIWTISENIKIVNKPERNYNTEQRNDSLFNDTLIYPFLKDSTTY